MQVLNGMPEQLHHHLCICIIAAAWEMDQVVAASMTQSELFLPLWIFICQTTLFICIFASTDNLGLPQREWPPFLSSAVIFNVFVFNKPADGVSIISETPKAVGETPALVCWTGQKSLPQRWSWRMTSAFAPCSKHTFPYATAISQSISCPVPVGWRKMVSRMDLNLGHQVTSWCHHLFAERGCQTY